MKNIYTQAKLRFNAWNTVYQAWRKRYMAGAIAVTLAAMASGAMAAPTGAEFLKGNGNVVVSGSATTVNITAADATRARAAALLNWKGGFNVANGESVHFNNAANPSAPLSVINVDNTGSVSRIDGTITSTKGPGATTVHLVNPVGIAIGATANIDVGGGFTAIVGNVKTENCASGTCVPITYANGAQVEVKLGAGAINISPNAAIKVAGSWDASEMTNGSGATRLTTAGGQTTLPVVKYAGSQPLDGLVDLSVSQVANAEGGFNAITWDAHSTVLSSAKYMLPEGSHLNLRDVTVNGGVTATWVGQAGNTELTNVTVSDTATRSGVLRLSSMAPAETSSVVVNSAVLESANGFGATLDISGLLSYLNAFTVDGAAGTLNTATISDSQIVSNLTARGSMGLNVVGRPTGSAALAGPGLNRAGMSTLEVALGSEVDFKISKNIGSTDYNISNLYVRGGKSLNVENTNAPTADGKGASKGTLRLADVSLYFGGDVSIKSGSSSAALTNVVLNGSGSLLVDSNGLRFPDYDFGGGIAADNLRATFSQGITLNAFEALNLSKGYLVTGSGDISLSNGYRNVAVTDTYLGSSTGNVAIRGNLGQLDVHRTTIQTAGNVAITNAALASDTVRGELALTCTTPDACAFDGAGKTGQTFVTGRNTINAGNVTISGENVAIGNLDLTASGNVAMTATNQLQVDGLHRLESTSTDAAAQVAMAANVLLLDNKNVMIETKAASVNLRANTEMRVSNVGVYSESGSFSASSTGNGNLHLNGVTVQAVGASVSTMGGAVTLDQVSLNAFGKGTPGTVSVQAGKDITLTDSSLNGMAVVSATSTNGNIAMVNSSLYSTAEAKGDVSGVDVSATNGHISMLDSSVIWSPAYYAQDAEGNFLAQAGDGTVHISGMASPTTLTTSTSSGLFGDTALHVNGVHTDDGTHTDVWTGDASPAKWTAASPSAKVSLTAKSITMEGSQVIAGQNLPAAPVVTPPPVVEPPVVTPPVVTPPVVTPPVVTPPVVTPPPVVEPPVVTPPVVTPPVVTPPVVTPPPVVEPPVVTPPVVTPPVVTPPVVVPPPVVEPPVVTPPVVTPPVVVPPPVVTPPVVVPPVVTPPVVTPPVVVPPVVVPPVVTPPVVTPPVVVPPVVVPPVVTPPVVVPPPVVVEPPAVTPPIPVKPIVVPVVVTTTRVQVADVFEPTIRADVVLVPGASSEARVVWGPAPDSQVETDKDKTKP